ncbi:MAG: hypothetical protein R3E48_20000 [Burkholderiaceae bacterium]
MLVALTIAAVALFSLVQATRLRIGSADLRDRGLAWSAENHGFAQIRIRTSSRRWDGRQPRLLAGRPGPGSYRRRWCDPEPLLPACR